MLRIAFLIVTLFLCSCTSLPQEVLDVRASVSHPRFGDTDPHKWASKKPWNYPVHGIDVAKYQGKIDWQKAKLSGVTFAFIKATEGGDHLDERFRENWKAARQAGVLRGAYHFYYFCRSANEQAKWFIRNVPMDRKSLPPVLDLEWNHASPTCRKRPSAEIVRAETAVFLKRLARHYGKRPLIYTTVDFYRANQLWRIKDHEFWLRSVAGHPSSVYPNQRWAFWQYTGTGTVPGIKGNTDINTFYGSQSQWENWVEKRTRG